MNPQLLLSKLGRRWFRRFPSPTNQVFVRNHFRKWCVRDEIISATLENFQMYASPHDYISFRIFFFGIYDPVMTTLLKAYIHEGSSCWDVGTERGWFSLLMGSVVGATGRVDAFEAYPPNYEKLCTNISLNKFAWVHPHNVAVSNRTGYMHFVPPSDEVTKHVSYLEDCGGSGYLTSELNPESIEVKTITLDQYAEETELDRLDVIKMDIEGAEFAALQGAQRTISKFRPILAIEYNRETARRAGTSVEELDNLLDSYGYDRFVFRRKLEKLCLEKWKDRSDSEAVFNVYCFPHK